MYLKGSEVITSTLQIVMLTIEHSMVFYSEQIIQSHFLVSLLNYKPCNTPLKYSCLIKKSDHIRLTSYNSLPNLSKNSMQKYTTIKQQCQQFPTEIPSLSKIRVYNVCTLEVKWGEVITSKLWCKLLNIEWCVYIEQIVRLVITHVLLVSVLN